jgi:hypothetical protein
LKGIDIGIEMKEKLKFIGITFLCVVLGGFAGFGMFQALKRFTTKAVYYEVKTEAVECLCTGINNPDDEYIVKFYEKL